MSSDGDEWNPSSDDDLDKYMDDEFEKGIKLKTKDTDHGLDLRLQLMRHGNITLWEHNEEIIVRLLHDGRTIWFRDYTQ